MAGVESRIQRSILDYLKLKNIVAWKNSNVGIYKKSTGQYIPSGTPGVSDILGVLHPSGRFLAIEVKAPKKYASPTQKVFLEQIRNAGGLAGVCRSIDDVIELLKEE